MTTLTISERIANIQARHNMTDEQTAEYLGVPVHTIRNWRTGKRIPAAVVHKLLDVLGTVETLAPAIHDHLMPAKG